MTNCLFTGNEAAGFNGGGGMYVNAASPPVTGCVFTANTATEGGGMTIMSSSAPAIFGCSFTANAATVGSGGGIIVRNGANPSVTASTLTGNVSVDVGGGVRVEDSALTATTARSSPTRRRTVAAPYDRQV